MKPGLAITACLLISASFITRAAPPFVFLGFSLGTEFSIPECRAGKMTDTSSALTYLFKFQSIDSPCWARESGPGGATPSGSDFTVKIVPSSAPNGLRDVDGVIVGGKLEGINAFTHGIRYQESLLAALTEKLGPPTSIGRGASKNAMGATFEIIEARWNKDGISVTFEGAADRIDWGLIKVRTTAGAAKDAATTPSQGKF